MKSGIVSFLTLLFIFSSSGFSFSAVFSVDNTGDTDNLLGYTTGDGSNSLRKCIRLANAAPGLDTIYFAIPAAPYIITAASDLPVISGSVLIDGFSQTGAAPGNLLVQIDGGPTYVLQLGAGSAGSTLRGLVLYGSSKGIYVNASSGNTIRGNHIGTNASATAQAGSPISLNGIHLSSASNTIIGGAGGIADKNIISGCGQDGILTSGPCPGTLIAGNYVGLNRTGMAGIGNGSRGIYLNSGAHNSIIGGTTPASRNLISGNSYAGLVLQSSTGCLIQNNFIGTDSTGNTGIGNIDDGINCSGGCPDLKILDNVISFNGYSGIELANANRCILKGNKVGIGYDGMTPLANCYGPFAGSDNGVRIGTCFKPVIGGTTVPERNIVSCNNNFGLVLFLADSAVVKGNYFGTDWTGMLDRGNRYDGMVLNSSQYGLIGGSTAAERNLFSGNDQYGLTLTSCSKTLIQSNFAGTDISGNAALPNNAGGIQVMNSPNTIITSNVISGNLQTGLGIYGTSHRAILKSNNIGVGTDGLTSLGNSSRGVVVADGFRPVIGSANPADRNIIAGNGADGLYLQNADSAVVQGNLIGVNVLALTDYGNAWSGISAVNSDDLLIGGGNPGEGNIVSGNNTYGINIGVSGGTATRATVQGNTVGLAIDLSTMIPNNMDGIYLFNCPLSLIGGQLSGQRNYVSSNGGNGILIDNSPYTIIRGNYVGVDGTGLLARGNYTSGIGVSSSREVTVGGGNSSARNIVGATRNGHGIIIYGTSKKCVVQGNFSGLGIDGFTDLGNWNSGIFLSGSADSVKVGGSSFLERNVSSCNGKIGSGFYIHGINAEGAKAHTILGNYAGVDSTGMLARPNAGAGIYIRFSANNIIGGAGQHDGNIASGNLAQGIFITNGTGNQMYGNIIGLASDILTPLANVSTGISLNSSSGSAIIGGSLSGQRNYISSNGGSGIDIDNSPLTLVLGNYIGTDVTGLLARGNSSNGIRVNNARQTVIGGNTAGARNIVADTRNGNGVFITGTSKKCIIQGNFIGLAKDGSTDLGNWNSGLYVNSSADTALIGGSAFMERNVVSCNGKSGVVNSCNGISIETSDVHTLLGNYVGVDSGGTMVKANQGAGLFIRFSSINNTIGGSGANDGNIFSGNKNEGIFLSQSVNNRIVGNFIGSDKTGTANLGNEKAGINMSATNTNDNIIGGSTANKNVIAYNQNLNGGSGAGVLLTSGARDLITHNAIYCNAGLGIQISAGQNQSVLPPAIGGSTPNDVSGTGTAGNTVHVYQNTTMGSGCDCEGEIYLGATLIPAGGIWTLTHNLGLNPADLPTITATQTTPLNSTSQFSTCSSLPVSMLWFEVTKPEEKALLKWSTVSERNNKEFEIQRSEDGIAFVSVGNVPGSGFSARQTLYSFEDDILLLSGSVYYRLKQIDSDGGFTYSPVRSLLLSNDKIEIFIRDDKELSLETFLHQDEELTMEIIDMSGRKIYSSRAQVRKGFSVYTLNAGNLAEAVYVVKIYGTNTCLIKKIGIW